MSVTPLQDFVSSILARQTTQSSAPVATPSSSTSTASSVDTPGSASILSTSSQTLTTANLHTAAVSIAQLGSLLEVSQGGIENAQSVLQSLQSLAEQAQQGGPPSALAQINTEFQDVLQQLNQIASGTQFDGTNVLDGSLSNTQNANSNAQSQGTQSSQLSLPDVSVQGLFGNNPPNVLSVADATDALTAIDNAAQTLNTANTQAQQTQDQVAFAAANVESAYANSAAASSVLSDSDLTGGTDTLGLQDAAAVSASVQGDSLTPALLSLLQA